LEKTSGRIPKRHALASELLHVFTKHLEEGVNSEATRFADDTDVNHTARMTANYKELQKDLTVPKAEQEDGR